MVSFDDFEYIQDNFFVIDNYNCDAILGKFYGFAVLDNEIIINQEKYNKALSNKTYGAYINVIRKKSKIIIQQDYWGTFGLFIFRKGDYFAISNSLLFLVQYVAKNNKLSLDENFLKYLLIEEIASLSYYRTLINEIHILPKNCTLQIDLQEKKLDLSSFVQQESIYPIDSKEGMEIIDNWHTKFSKLLYSLNQSSQDIKITLSGGLDSRAMLAGVSDNIHEFNEYNISSAMDKFHQDDYNIATKIAERYQFTLNQVGIGKNDNINLTYNMSFMVSLLSKSCIHKHYHFKNQFRVKPKFVFTGIGGEAIREKWSFIDKNEFTNLRVNGAYLAGGDYSREVQSILLQSYDYLSKNFSGNLVLNLYKHTRLRSVLKSTIEGFLINEIKIAPLLDPSLYLIKVSGTPENLIYSLLYERFLPKINDINFEGNREICQETKKIALFISNRYQKKMYDNTIFEVKYNRNKFPTISKKLYNTEQEFNKLLYFEPIKNFSCEFFSENVYFVSRYLAEQDLWKSNANSNVLITSAIFDSICRSQQFNLTNCLEMLS